MCGFTSFFQNELAMISKKFRLFLERADIQDLRDAPAVKDRPIQCWGNDEFTVIGERDEATVKQMIDMWREHQAIASV